MPDLHTMHDTRNSYQDIITKGLDCVCRNDIRSAIITEARIEHLLRILAPVLKTREVIKMETNLYQMKESLTLLISLH